MPSKPFLFIRAAQVGLFLNTAIWLILGIWSLARLAERADPSITMLVVAVLMFGNTAAFLFCGMTIGRKSHWFKIFAYLVLGVNILLTFTDQVGLIDWLTVLIDLCVLFFLIASRKQYAR